jgi:hypothetical protein
MIEAIIKHIDSSPELYARFQKLVEAAYDELELAETIKRWFIVHYDQDVVVKPAFLDSSNDYDIQLCSLMDDILGHTIHGITFEGWLTIAQHLWQRYWNERSK